MTADATMGPPATVLRIAQHGLAAALLVIAVVGVGLERAEGPGWSMRLVLALAVAACLVVVDVIGLRRGLDHPRTTESTTEGTATRRGVLLWVVALIACWAVGIAVSEKFIWLAFVLFLFIWQVLPFGWALACAGTVLAGVVVAWVGHTGALAPAAVVGPTIGAVATAVGVVLQRRWRAEAESRRALIEDLVRTRAALAASERAAGRTSAREDLAREIHDTVGQQLASIGLLLTAALDPATPEDARRSQVEAARSAASEGLSETRRMVRALGRRPDPDAGEALSDLTDALAAVAADSASLGLPVDLALDPLVVPLPTRSQVALLRGVQESLANTRRHARAHRAWVSLGVEAEVVRVSVRDDGVGFDVAEAAERGLRADGSGFGLRSMATRLAELGGRASVESSPRGTLVTLEVPR